MKSTDLFKKTIEAYLTDKAINDSLFEPFLLNPNKNIDDCITYILNTVKDSGMNAFAEDEIFGMAVRYKLPPLTEVQKRWIYDNFFEFQAYRTKGELTCFECGHRWKKTENEIITSLNGCVCPNCKRQLDVRLGKQRTLKDSGYLSIVTTYKGFQVIRNFTIKRSCRVSYEAFYDISEVVQNWISPEGDYEAMSVKFNSMSYYYDNWIDNTLEIRSQPNNQRYKINPFKIYPQKRFIDNVKRNGFKGEFDGMTPSDLLILLLKSSKAETLLKANQLSLLKYYYLKPFNFKKFWPSIKICIRNGYLVKDAFMWCDHIDLLEYFQKDVRNPKYVCPEDLNEEHIRLTRKKQRLFDLLSLKQKKEQALKDEASYLEMKGRFFDLDFRDEQIEVVPLKSVFEFIEESEIMHHCVFSNAYYKKQDSLILSARRDNKRIETVEVSLSKFDVIQCHGSYNKSTEYHDHIINLIKNNMNEIRMRV